MKTYNIPTTEINELGLAYMLMVGNVSGGGFQGVHETTGEQTIIIN